MALNGSKMSQQYTVDSREEKMSQKHKFHQNWNVTKTKMSPKFLKTFLVVLSQDNQSLALIDLALVINDAGVCRRTPATPGVVNIFCS